MVMPDVKIMPPGVGIIVPGYRTGVNTAPRRSNQTPEGPGNPMPLLSSQFQGYQPWRPGIQQRIKTVTPHTTPNIDNYQGEHNYAGAPGRVQPWQTGIRQRMKNAISTNLPPGVNPGSYINESITNPPGIKTVGYQAITGSTGYPRQIITLSIPGPQPIKQIGYAVEQPWQTGIRQHSKAPIAQIVPQGVYPDTYGKKQMSYDGASTFLIGGIFGFALGAIIFTATGRNLAKATATRATSYIQPKS